MPVTNQTTIDTSHKGAVDHDDLERAVDKVRSVAERAREPVPHIEVRLTLGTNPAHERPAKAESTIDINGRHVRAHAASPTMAEAVDALVDRLRYRLDRHEDRIHRMSDRHRTGDSGPGEWHHGDLPTARPPWLDVPYEEREIRRSKTFAMEPMSIEEAAFDVVQLDHGFYLFVDAATGGDAFIERSGDGGFDLRHASGVDGNGDATVPAEGGTVRLLGAAAPVLDDVGAKEHLDASGEASLFFVGEGSGRGQVLYRRDDGHYGLIGPR